ncbi:MAG: histidine phosphatase family protein [Tissierellia bacterium]|nr:histidine phosphatase family protein [Tissierellia bacterium]
MKLYIIRHGETKWNREGRMQGWLDSELTKEAEMKAKNLHEKLKPKRFDKVYSSDLNRAINTAKLVSGFSNEKIIKKRELREIELGKWQGMLFKDIKKEYPKLLDIYFNDSENYNPADSENFCDLYNRINKFLEEIKDLNDKNILIVTHGVTMIAILNIIRGIGIKDFWNMEVPDGLTPVIYKYEDDKFELLDTDL